MLIKLHVMVSQWVTDLKDHEDGQTMVEYGLILAFVAIAIIAALGFLAGGVNSLLTQVKNAL